MSVVEPIARAAILDGGLAGLLALAGGAMRVALFYQGTECSGNGYARQSFNEIGAATNGASGATAACEDVIFTPSGGSIVYDQVKVFNRSGATLLLSSSVAGAITISGEPHTVTVQINIPPNQQENAFVAADVVAAVGNQFTSKADVLCAAGDFLFAESLRIVDGVGGRLSGAGGHDSYQDSNPLIGTNFIWGGGRAPEDTEPLVYYDRDRGQFDGINFRGADIDAIWAGSVDKAPVGFEMRRAGGAFTGIGSGKTLMRDCSFTWFRTGLKLADDRTELNCDESSWYDLQFEHCDVAIEFNSLQTMGHVFYHPRFRHHTDVFQINAGGKLRVNTPLITKPCNFLNFPAANAYFGQNNAAYVIDNAWVDSQATGAKFVNMGAAIAGYYADCYFDNLHLPSPQIASVNKPFWGGDSIALAFDASGNTTIHLRNVKNLQRGMLGFHTGTDGVTRYVVENCRLWWNSAPNAITDVRDTIGVALSTGKCHFEFRGCYADGAPLADWSGYIDGTE